MSWADLYAFIFAAPPNTAVFHAFEKGWTTTDYLLAHVVDGQRMQLWQRTEDATKATPRNLPVPFPRPGDDEPKKKAAVGDTVAVGSTVGTVTTVGRFMELRAEREKRWREQHNRGV